MSEASVQSEQVVSWEQPEDEILVVKLERHPTNALGLPIIDGLNAALDHADANPGIKVMIIASEIDRFFAAGADIKHMVTADETVFAAYGVAMRAMMSRLAAPDRLSIAAVEGMAFGGGLELTMVCTMRVGGADAQFGLPEVKIGLIPGAGGTQRLPRLVGRGRALDIMLTGRKVPAQEAHAIGLIDRLVDAGSALDEALALARELCGYSQPALLSVLRTVDASYDLPLAEGSALEASDTLDLVRHGEAMEGLTAFVEKRPPNFA
jgi:enoyl-CoA hydratase